MDMLQHYQMVQEVLLKKTKYKFIGADTTMCQPLISFILYSNVIDEI